jgi:hypothetical protein
VALCARISLCVRAAVLGRRGADAARFIQNQARVWCVMPARRAAAVAIKGSGWHRKIHIIRC